MHRGEELASKGAVAKWSGEYLDVKKARDWDATGYQGSAGGRE